MDAAKEYEESERIVDNSPLLAQVRDHIRRLHYSIRTETAYLGWIKRYILYHGKRHPGEMGEPEIAAYLSHLAVNRKVAASTQNQALNALVFLYRKVLGRDLAQDMDIRQAKRPERLPTVFERDEVRRILGQLDGTPGLIVSLLYGSGMRLLECLRLRVQDIHFERKAIAVRSGKGHKDRMTLLPAELIPGLQQQLRLAKAAHQADLAEGYGEVYLPYALERKYPNANKEWGWQYVFFASKRAVDPRSGKTRRHHLDQSVVNKALKRAMRQAGIQKRGSCHSMRHSFATHMLEDDHDIRTVQTLLGHKDVKTTRTFCSEGRWGSRARWSGWGWRWIATGEGRREMTIEKHKLPVGTTRAPGEKGTKKLAQTYGDSLVCVRYRYDERGRQRYTTAEIVVAQTVWEPPTEERAGRRRTRNPRDRVGVKILFSEIEVREQVKQLGAKWRPRQKLWELTYAQVDALRLAHRIVSQE